LTAAKLAQLKKRWIKVPQDVKKKTLPCPVCKEIHKPEWAEEEEEWVFRNAIEISGIVRVLTVSSIAKSDSVDIPCDMPCGADVSFETHEGRRETE
jgi:hypothetical protein